VIACARARTGAAAGLDDLEARAFAQGLGLRVIGIVGMLVRAKRSGMIADVGALLSALASEGFRLAPVVCEEALRLAGE
jgi:predicted nucleic acid-binding protein